MKIHSTALFLVLSALLKASDVQGKIYHQQDLGDIHHVFPVFKGANNQGLLTRTINSQRPTQHPTLKPTPPSYPTESPTESPAPSPSPSENPTKDPDRPTDPPTESPTESPAPSPSPSENPTPIPSAQPSDAPSAAPSKSSAPSAAPTATPSVAPSDFPSLQPSAGPTKSAEPSAAPTESPSDMPSDVPSFSPSQGPTASVQPSDLPSSSPSTAPSTSPSNSPTAMPSEFPSDAPSMSPTSITDRTKTGVATLLLEEIPNEMDRMTLAEFELFTLDFLREKIVDPDYYTLNTLAVTVLSQRNVYNSTQSENSTQPVFRKLESEAWSVALEVDIRTVSVVTDGRVPQNFNFTREVLLGFYNHWDQYLWQLGNSVDFFNPLIEVSDWEPQQNEAAIFEGKKGNTSFVFAVMFSFVAFGLALYASFLAIRKHLRRTGMTPHKNKNKSRGLLFSPRNSPTNYSGADVLNYLTQTMSEDKSSPIHNYHDGDVEGGGAHNLMRNVNIDIDENGMESVVLTPRGNFHSPHASVRNGLFVVNEGSDDDRSPYNDAGSPMEEDLQQRPSTGRIGGQIKKWLTPRALKNGYAMSSNSPNRRLSSDPPENQSILGYNYGKDNKEPFAKKASTKNDSGVYTTDKSTIDGRSKATGISYNKKRSDEGQFTLPMSFFSNRGPGTNVSGAESPLSSLADSEASSFFAIGNMNKTFTGQRSTTGALEDEGYEVTSTKMKTNVPRYNNVVAVAVKADRQKQTIEQNENAPPSPPSPPAPPPPPAPPAPAPAPTAYVRSLVSPSENSAKDSSVKLAAKRFEPLRQQKQLEQLEQLEQKPLREIRPPNSTVGVETILGARSRDSADDESDKGSNASSAFLKSRSIFSPGERKKDKKVPTQQPKRRYGKVSVEVQEQEARSVASTSTLGARPLERNYPDRDDKSTVSAFSTLSSVMKRPGCYDVYAPSGPIGIVVDTSKYGPSVHSLKSTSPMLGLITPGDLIIALDGEDTRKMTAAALTRLMARKSRQKERKITLIS